MYYLWWHRLVLIYYTEAFHARPVVSWVSECVCVECIVLKASSSPSVQWPRWHRGEMLKGRATFFKRVRHLHGEYTYTRNRKQESARRLLLVSWLIIQGGRRARSSLCVKQRVSARAERKRPTRARTRADCFVFAAIFRGAQPEISGQFVHFGVFAAANIIFYFKKKWD